MYAESEGRASAMRRPRWRREDADERSQQAALRELAMTIAGWLGAILLIQLLIPFAGQG